MNYNLKYPFILLSTMVYLISKLIITACIMVTMAPYHLKKYRIELPKGYMYNYYD